MRKYINLLLKDLLVYKNIFFLITGFIIFMNLLSFMIYPINNFISFAELSILETSSFFVLYKLEEQKNLGEKLILTTPYTRRNIAISRFIVASILILIELGTYLGGVISSRVHDLEINSILGELFVSYLFISIIIPFSFNKSAKWLLLSTTCMTFLYWKFKNFFILSHLNLTFTYLALFMVIFIVLTFLIGVASLKLSIKIFNSQDL